MNIIVCLKQILDPEIPVRDFRIDAEKRQAVRGNANLVTNIFCENALETALQFREKSAPDAKITALIFAPESGEVAAAIRKLGAFDLVMVGRESGDWGVGQTGGLLAEELGCASVSFVDSVEKNGDGLLLKRQTDNGWERVEAKTPLVVTVTNNDQNVPRIPKTRDIMMSSRQPITKLSLEEIGVNADEIRSGGSYYEIVELAIPVKDVNCEFVSGDTLEQKVEQLAQKILDVTRAL